VVKYIFPKSIEEWIQSPGKNIHNVLIMWKAILAFPLIRNWLVWDVGLGNMVKVGKDPWRGGG
jgi:hypothetical protein